MQTFTDLTITLLWPDSPRPCLRAGWIGGRLQAEWWTGSGWREQVRDPNLPALRLTEGKLHPILQRVPADLCTLVKPVQHAQFLLLQMGLHSLELRQLLESCLNLAWLLAEHAQRSETMSWKDMTHLASQTRPQILKALGLTPTPAALRLLGKIRPVRFDKQELVLIRQALANPSWIKALRHQPVISVTTLDLLEKWPLFLESSLLPEVALMYQEDIKNFYPAFVTNRFKDHETILRDTLRMGQELAIQNFRDVALGCTSIEQLRRMHDRWMERIFRLRNYTHEIPVFLQNWERQTLLDAPEGPGTAAFLQREAEQQIPQQKSFPRPPFPGNEHILPIQTPEELIEEGKALKHCVGSYADAIKLGESYIYKVLQPQRGTLEIHLGQAGGVSLSQFKLARNEEPSAAAWASVWEWFGQQPGVKISAGNSMRRRPFEPEPPGAEQVQIRSCSRPWYD